ncbi:unnamed protein product, partial [Prorocentrum cordatum]
MGPRAGAADAVLEALLAAPLLAAAGPAAAERARLAARLLAERAERTELPAGEELDLRGRPMMVVHAGELRVRMASGPTACFGPGSVLNALGALGLDGETLERDSDQEEPQPTIRRAATSSPTPAGRLLLSPRAADVRRALWKDEEEEAAEAPRSAASILGNLCPHWTPPGGEPPADAPRRPSEALGRLVATSACPDGRPV